MKPPKKKKKKKAKKKSGSESTSQVLDPATEVKKKRYPGLSLPDNAERVLNLLKPEEMERENSQNVKVASEALNEVRV